MLTSIIQSAALGWIWRRAQELVAHATWIIPMFLAIPKPYQELLIDVIRGQGGGYSISVYIGFVGFLWTQFQSYRATTMTQIVSQSGQKTALPKGSNSARQAEAVAAAAPKPKTIWERLTSR